jgi:hypothetical protein
MVYTDGTHIVADTTKELHAFAKKQEIMQSYYTEGSTMPRYFIPKGSVKKVIAAGASHISIGRAAEIARHSGKREDDGPAKKNTMRCRFCGAELVMLQTNDGLPIPVHAETVRDTSEKFYSPWLGHISHYRECVKASQHRNAKNLSSMEIT